MATTIGSLGIVYEKKADMPKARKHWHKALDLWRKIGNPGEVKKYAGWLRGANSPRRPRDVRETLAVKQPSERGVALGIGY